MYQLLQLYRKTTSFFNRIFNYKGIYIHWLAHDDVEDITEIVLSKEFDKNKSSNDIEY